eukprot:TRINITY_DN13159_c0_g1_i1.p1 TRINITY_DN13159_c0_g1~~TRINITY_DN13159_c0_g1_i1.p1  ORF type:complete len:174 (+),score=26.14 TRINITY_DN13159_c0_g1_i1:95-616(+)
MGHSEGGISSMVAEDPELIPNDYGISWTAIVVLSGCFPPDPIGEKAAKYGKLPILFITGTSDCICPDTIDLGYYHISPSACKYFVDIVNATHCAFASPLTIAEFFCFDYELYDGCGFAASLTVSTQQALVLKYVVPWLQWQLKSIPTAKYSLNAALNIDQTHKIINYLSSCST